MVVFLLISYFIFVGVRPNFTLFYPILSYLIIILNLTWKIHLLFLFVVQPIHVHMYFPVLGSTSRSTVGALTLCAIPTYTENRITSLQLK